MSKGFRIIILLLMGFGVVPGLGGAEEPHLMPGAFSKSLIMGKRLKNPFAAKLLASQSKVKAIASGTSGVVEVPLNEQLILRTAMHFGQGSVRNRAIINDKVCRPNDVLLEGEAGGFVIQLHEILEKEVILRHHDPKSGQTFYSRLASSSSYQRSKR